jgi:hypothetical protein
MRRTRFVLAALVAAVLLHLLVLERTPPPFHPLDGTTSGGAPGASSPGCVWACSLGTCSATAPPEAPSPAAATTPAPDAPVLRGRLPAQPAEDAPGAADPAAEAAAPSSPVEVTGVVLDEIGRPLAGARLSWRIGWG